MKTLRNNIWFKGALAFNVYFSCAAFSLFLIYGTKEMYTSNMLPERLYGIFIYVVISWLVTAYYSEEKYWHTLLKLLCYSLALVSLAVLFLGLKLITMNFTSDTVQIDITISIIIIIFGGLSIFGFVKLGNSKWLNT